MIVGLNLPTSNPNSISPRTILYVGPTYLIHSITFFFPTFPLFSETRPRILHFNLSSLSFGRIHHNPEKKIENQRRSSKERHEKRSKTLKKKSLKNVNVKYCELQQIKGSIFLDAMEGRRSLPLHLENLQSFFRKKNQFF